MDSRDQQIKRETRVLRAFQRKADDVSKLILNTDLPWVDIEIRIDALRRECERLFPGKSALFDRIYGSRFARLRTQWRRSE
ncbi:MAG: hypothetical protein JXR37_16865 [Kiritimatiellae bacterium]|nr:hypothetical protein [Kiritimatiellia bacterium]